MHISHTALNSIMGYSTNALVLVESSILGAVVKCQHKEGQIRLGGRSLLKKVIFLCWMPLFPFRFKAGGGCWVGWVRVIIANSAFRFQPPRDHVGVFVHVQSHPLTPVHSSYGFDAETVSLLTDGTGQWSNGAWGLESHHRAMHNHHNVVTYFGHSCLTCWPTLKSKILPHSSFIYFFGLLRLISHINRIKLQF